MLMYDIFNILLVLFLDGFNNIFLELLEMESQLSEVLLEVIGEVVKNGIYLFWESWTKRCLNVFFHGRE